MALLALMMVLVPHELLAQTSSRNDGGPLTITTTELPPLNVLELYRAPLAAEGGLPPYSWTVDVLPNGLILDPTGLIINDPDAPAITDAQAISLNVTVTDAAGDTAMADLPLDVIVVEQVAVGQEHVCAVTSMSTVYCWGRNISGQLGDGTTEDRPFPVAVQNPDDPTGLMTGVVAVTASDAHTCAVTEDGSVYCWGFNGAGRLGLGHEEIEAFLLPGRVVGPAGGDAFLTDVVAVSAGGLHTCALTNAGIAYCWGDNFRGQIGRPVQTGGTPITVATPGNPDQPLPGLTAIGTGGFHTCAITTAGTGYCWGWNNAGQLGVGQSFPVQSSTPLLIRDPADLNEPLTGLAHVGGGGVHTCAGTTSGVGYCWGQNAHGQIGDGNAPNNSLAPALVVDPANPETALGNLVSVGPGTIHSCGRTTTGTAYCWGSNSEGQLGNGTTESSDLAVTVLGPGTSAELLSNLQALSHRGWQTCGLTETGSLYCWGHNAYGQLGDGTTENQHRPVAVHPGRPAAAVLALTPNLLDFGKVPVDETSETLSLTLSNPGTAALEVTHISAPATPFAVIGGSCSEVPFTLTTDESCSLDLALSPDAPGKWIETMAVTSNAGTHTVLLIGTTSGPDAPENDNMADANFIPVANATYAGTNVGATLEDGEPEPSCTFLDWTTNFSVWWTFTADAETNRVTIDTFDSDFDTILSLHRADDLSEVACDDDTNGLQSQIENAPIVAGETYLIRVAGYNESANNQGDVQLTTVFYSVSGEDDPNEIVQGITHPNPNPVREMASFTLSVEHGQQVTVEVFDMMGRRVQVLYEGSLAAGATQTLRLDANALSSGVYVIRALGEDFVDTRRVTVVR